MPEAPILVTAPAELDFEENLSELTFTITNAGTGTLSWSSAQYKVSGSQRSPARYRAFRLLISY